MREDQCDSHSGKLILMQLLKPVKASTGTVKETRGIRTKVLALVKGDYKLVRNFTVQGNCQQTCVLLFLVALEVSGTGVLMLTVPER